MSKDKRKHHNTYQERYQQYQDRLRETVAENKDRLYRYDEIDGSNNHLIPKSELQSNFYGFTKWLSKEHSGKIVSVFLEDKNYVVTWKAETKDAVDGSSSFDGIPVKYIRVKTGNIIF